MDTMLKISKDLMQYPIFLGLFILAISMILNSVTLNKNSFSWNASEFFITGIKAVAYGLLALLVYLQSQSLKEIDVLTYFTFLLACLETGHNLANSLGYWVVVLIKSQQD